MEKIKVDFKSQTIQIVSGITVKEFLTVMNAINLLSFTINVPSNDILFSVRTESDNIRLLKNSGRFTNKVIAEKLGLNERTLYRKLKELGIK